MKTSKILEWVSLSLLIVSGIILICYAIRRCRARRGDAVLLDRGYDYLIAYMESSYTDAEGMYIIASLKTMQTNGRNAIDKFTYLQSRVIPYLNIKNDERNEPRIIIERQTFRKETVEDMNSRLSRTRQSSTRYCDTITVAPVECIV